MLIALLCEACGHPFEGGPRARFCPVCRAERQRDQNAAYRRRKRKGDVRELGTTDTCTACGREYEVEGGNQRYCPSCAPAAVAAVDRRQGMEYYTSRKDEINPARNVARRKARSGPHRCERCTKIFYGLYGDGCCSEPCREEKRRLRQARYDAARKGLPIPDKPPHPKRKFDWSGVDWSKSNNEIAADTGQTPGTVWAARKRLQKDKDMTYYLSLEVSGLFISEHPFNYSYEDENGETTRLEKWNFHVVEAFIESLATNVGYEGSINASLDDVIAALEKSGYGYEIETHGND